MIGKIDPKSYVPLARQAFISLRDAIINNEFEPGSILSERELANTFGISRTPIREGLRLLESEGWVEFLPKKGYQILTFSDGEVLHTYGIRSQMMTYVVKVAARNGISNEDSNAIDEILKKGWDVIERDENIDAFLSLAQDFDLVLARSCNSRIVIKTLSFLFDCYAAVRRKSVIEKERRIRIWKEHEEILNYIKEKDEAKALQAMKDHISSGADIILSQKQKK